MPHLTLGTLPPPKSGPPNLALPFSGIRGSGFGFRTQPDTNTVCWSKYRPNGLKKISDLVVSVVEGEHTVVVPVLRFDGGGGRANVVARTELTQLGHRVSVPRIHVSCV